MLSARLTHSVKLIHIKNYECEAHSHLSYYCEAHSQLRYGCEAHSHLSYYCGAHSSLCYECEAHSHLSYYCEVHSQLRYECEAHSHLSYYCYVMGVKLIHIFKLRVCQDKGFILYTHVSMWRWIKTGSFRLQLSFLSQLNTLW